MFISHYNGHGIKLVRPLSIVDNTRDYARVSHSRQWSNYNVLYTSCCGCLLLPKIHYTRFAVTSPYKKIDGEVANLLQTCSRQGKLSRHVKMSPTSPQQFGNKTL